MPTAEPKIVLIVDDYASVREVLRDSLRDENVEVLEAKSGAEARKLIADRHPDLVLLDVMLPEGIDEGFELCREIKSDTETEDIAVVFVTRRAFDDDIARTRDLQAEAHLAKPFDYIDIVTRVKKVLGV